MLKKLAICLLLAGFLVSGVSPGDPTHGADPSPSPQALKQISHWLSASFGLPETDRLPRVIFADRATMFDIRYGNPSRSTQGTDVPDYPAVATTRYRKVVALYDDTTETVILSDDWSGATPADFSILVHEMVHHIQNITRKNYDCPAARERVAYQAQERWLNTYGKNLAVEFEIDPLTLLVTTSCMD